MSLGRSCSALQRINVWTSALLLAACGGGADDASSESQRSLLLVTFDTTRADRIGCYGYPDAGTPTLDGLAAHGTRFTRAYASVPITLPSHTSVLTGSYPPYHGIRDNGLFVLNERVETLAETCARAGYRTGAFVSAFPLFGMFGLNQGFEVYDDHFQPTESGMQGYMRERPAGDTVRVTSNWLRSLAPEDHFFAWVHFFDPHDPLQAPAEFAQRFPDDPYQAEISYTDAALGRLLDELEELGRGADTLVAVTADHGESLGDHREEKHALLLYDSTLHVPLILAGPGVSTGVVKEAVSLVDVAPTLVELAGLDDDGAFSRRGGRSLARLARGGAPNALRELYFETYYPRLHHGWSELVGIAFDGWKYVEAPGTGAAELYRPDEDPGELNDLAGEQAETVRELSERLTRLRVRLEADSPRSRRHEMGEQDLENLAALGYAGPDLLAPELSATREAAPGRDPRDVVEATTYLNAVRSNAIAGRTREAQAALERLQAIDGEGVIYFEASGDLHLALGRAGNAQAFERAAADFQRATELKPGRRGPWTRRSEALQSMGRYAEALRCLEHALTLAPPTPALLEARAALRRAVAGQGQ